MQTSIGTWDSIFGKKVTIELPMPNGDVKRVRVTKRWLAEMQRQGKIKQVGEKQEVLLQKAGNLVQVARLNAIGMFTPFLEQFPILQQVDTEQWDFVLTVAGVFMAASRLNNLRLGDAAHQK